MRLRTLGQLSRRKSYESKSPRRNFNNRRSYFQPEYRYRGVEIYGATLARSSTALEWPVKIFLTPLVCRFFCYINPVYFRLDIPQTT